jgi:hypothetical protein
VWIVRPEGPRRGAVQTASRQAAQQRPGFLAPWQRLRPIMYAGRTAPATAGRPDTWGCRQESRKGGVIVLLGMLLQGRAAGRLQTCYLSQSGETVHLARLAAAKEWQAQLQQVLCSALTTPAHGLVWVLELSVCFMGGCVSPR